MNANASTRKDGGVCVWSTAGWWGAVDGVLQKNSSATTSSSAQRGIRDRGFWPLRPVRHTTPHQSGARAARAGTCRAASPVRVPS